MSKPSVGQLLEVLRNEKPPAGFSKIPLGDLDITVTGGDARIDYVAYFNSSTNQIILSGTPKPQTIGGDGMGGEATIEDAGIFYDATVISSGADAGRFVEKPVPVAQTEAILSRLTGEDGFYKGASVSLVGEGSVGLAFSVTSYNLRNGSADSGQIDGAVTLNSWMGRWTNDGAPDTGVLDVRTRDVGLGDPAYGVGVTTSGVAAAGWTPGAAALRVDVDLAGIDRAVASILSDVAAQETLDAAVGAATSRLPDAVGNAISWTLEQVIGLVSDELKPVVVDWLSNWVGERIESSEAINSQVGWISELSASDAATVVGGHIGLPQWNAMHGLSASGIEPGVVRYDTTAAPTTVGTGPNAETRQSVTQITTYVDPQTQAVMEIRVQGQLQNGTFVAAPGAVSVLGVAADGRVVIGDRGNQVVVMPGQTAVAANVSVGDSSLALSHVAQGAAVLFGGNQSTRVAYVPILESDGSVVGWRAEISTTDTQGTRLVSSSQFDANGDYVRSEVRSYDAAGNYTGTSGASYELEQQIRSSLQSPFRVEVRGCGVVPGVTPMELDAETGEYQYVCPPPQVTPPQSPDQHGANTSTGENFGQASTDIGAPPKPGDPIAVITDAGNGTMTDAGPVNGYGGSSAPTSPEPTPTASSGQSLAEWASTVGSGLAQSVIDALNASGCWSPEAINGFEVLTQTNGSHLIVDASGTVIGSVQDAYTSADGAPAWQRVQIEGESDPIYLPPQGGNPVSADVFESAQTADMSNAFGAFSSLANGLENWGSMNDAQRLAALVSFYNQIDHLGAAVSGSTLLPGDVGPAASGLAGALSLYYGLENGNDAQTLSGALQLYSAYTTYIGTTAGAASSAAGAAAAETAASSAAGDAAASSAASEIPYVGIALALTQVEDNPWGAVASVCACYPPYGTIIAVFINAMLMMFPEDIPTSVGEASVHIDEGGAVVVDTTVDEAGGGGTAAHWAQALAQMAQGAGMSAPQAGAPAQFLPSVGYYYDPDGFNFAGSQGQLALRWTGEDGSQHQTLYDSGGMRWGPDSDPSQPDIIRDYFELMQSREPQWPPVMYQEVTGGILQRDYGVATVLYATALGTYDGQAAHTQGGEQDSDGGQEQIAAGDPRLFGLTDNTIANSSTQTRLNITNGQISSVPAAMGANPNGPQVPSGKDPIVFVPLQALTGQGSERTVTASMLSGLSQFGALTDAQLAAIAIALGAGALPFMSHANTLAGATADANADGAKTFTDAQGNIWNLDALAAAVNAELGDGAWTAAWAATARPADLTNTTAVTVTNTSTTTETVQTPVIERPVLTSLSPATDNSSTNDNPLPSNWQTSIDPGAPPLQAGNDLALDYPTVGDDHVFGLEDGELRLSAIELLANDKTPNPVPRGSSGNYYDGLQIISVGNPVNGRVGIENGQVVFIPDANFNGDAGFSYTVIDMYGLTHTGTVWVYLEPVNDTPEVAGESATGSEDATLLFASAALLANDSDIDGDTLRISRVGEASGGVVMLMPDGNVSFVPTPNYNGPAGYSYWVSDGSEEVRTEVRLNILQVNDLPQVHGELVASDEDVVLKFPVATLLANDSDVDTNPALNLNGVQTLTISAVSNAQHGTVQLVNGEVQFIPDQDYFGPASFQYLVDDGAGGQVAATVVLVIAPVNDAPVVLDESRTIAEDNTLIYTQAQLLANDSDVDNPHSDLHITQVGGAVNGSVQLLPNGDIRFIPDADYFGPAQFDYLVSDGVGGQTLGTVTLDVTPVNDAPRLQGEQIGLNEDSIATMTATQLLANDHDVDNAHSDLSITAVGNAQHGTVVMDAQGNITFTPVANYYGAASFSYTVSDGMGGNSTTTVQLDYASVNDLPVVNGELMVGYRGVSYTYSQAALLANDTDVESPNSLQIVAVGGAQNGTVTLLPDGQVQFVPAGGYDSWSPAVYGSFDYTVRDADGGESATHTVIDYSRVNQNPIAVDDAFHGYEDVRLDINVGQLTQNDHDPDAGQTLTVDQVGNASHGTVSLNNGVVSFAPDPDYWGGASFQYRVNDGNSGVTWATATIDIERENRAPVITWAYTEGGPDATLTYVMYPNPENGENGGIPYVTRVESVDDTRRVNGMIYAVDPDGDSIEFTIYADGQGSHGSAFVGAYYDPSAPAGLSPAQLAGGAPTTNMYSFPAGLYAEYGVLGLDVNDLAGGYHNYWQGNSNSDGNGASAAWQYINNDVTGYTGGDSFTITATDSRGLSSSYTIGVYTEGWGGGSGGCFPVVVDTGNDGIDLVKPEDSHMFADINGDGWRDQIGWVSSSDALLAYDSNGDGQINRVDEVSFTSYLPGARTDLEGLAAFDSNGDGKLTVEDAQWNQFGMLQDRNGNGVQDDGEWVTLQDSGVTHIDLVSDGHVVENNGNVVFGQTTVGFADGSTRTAGDVMFAGNGVQRPDWVETALKEPVTTTRATTAALPPAVDPLSVQTPAGAVAVATTGAETSMTNSVATPVLTPSIEQQASAFVQMVTTEETPSAPLGFVDAHSLALGTDPVVTAEDSVVPPPVTSAAIPTATPALV